MIDLELTKVLPFEKLRAFTVHGSHAWCKANFTGEFNYNFDYDRLQIEDPRDYTLFMLKWA